MTSDPEIMLLLHCRNLPGSRFCGYTAVRLGIQRGQEVIGDVPGDAQGVTFSVPLRVMNDPKNGRLNFLGPFAQGRGDNRFIYLSWGERKMGEWNMFRRAKIMLRDLDPKAVEDAVRFHLPIEATLNMTDAKGEPLCARVKGEHIHWSMVR